MKASGSNFEMCPTVAEATNTTVTDTAKGVEASRGVSEARVDLLEARGDVLGGIWKLLGSMCGKGVSSVPPDLIQKRPQHGAKTAHETNPFSVPVGTHLVVSLKVHLVSTRPPVYPSTRLHISQPLLNCDNCTY